MEQIDISPGPICGLPLVVLAQPAVAPTSYPYPYAHPNTSLWYNARAAIWQGIHALGLGIGDRVLVPAYACGAELDVLLKAGLKLDFYGIKPDLSIDLHHVAKLCETPARAIYIIHYFGIAQPLDAIVACARTHGLLLIEDNAHGLCSNDTRGRALGSVGDMAVFSFPKTLALPDGGALVLKPRHTASTPHLRGTPPNAWAVAGKMKSLLESRMMSRFPRATRRIKKTICDPLTRGIKAVLNLQNPPEIGDISLEFRVDRGQWTMSRLARLLLRRADGEQVRELRRRNFAALHSAVCELSVTMPLIKELPAGASPWVYPIRTAYPQVLSAYLNACGVEHFRLWSFVLKHVSIERFPFEVALKQSVLALPIHQDLELRHMHHIAQVLAAWRS